MELHTVGGGGGGVALPCRTYARTVQHLSVRYRIVVCSIKVPHARSLIRTKSGYGATHNTLITQRCTCTALIHAAVRTGAGTYFTVQCVELY
jgi:hypothetical protein